MEHFSFPFHLFIHLTNTCCVPVMKWTDVSKNLLPLGKNPMSNLIVDYYKINMIVCSVNYQFCLLSSLCCNSGFFLGFQSCLFLHLSLIFLDEFCLLFFILPDCLIFLFLCLTGNSHQQRQIYYEMMNLVLYGLTTLGLFWLSF